VTTDKNSIKLTERIKKLKVEEDGKIDSNQKILYNL